MKKILIVDLDAEFIKNLSNHLKGHSDNIEIKSVKCGKKAAQIINSDDINLIIIDLKMPEIENFEALVSAVKKHSKIPVLVITSFDTPEIEAKVKALNASSYFEKPVNTKIFVEKIFATLNSTSENQMKGIGLTSFLQMAEMENTSCTIKVTANKAVGVLHISK